MYFIKNFKSLFDFNLYFSNESKVPTSFDVGNSNEIGGNLSSIDKLKVTDELKKDIKEKCVFLKNSEVTEIVSKLAKIKDSDIKNIFDQIQGPLRSYEIEEFLEKLYLFSSPDDYIQNDIIGNDGIDSSKLSPKQKEFYDGIVSLRNNLSQVQSSKEYFGKMKTYLDTKINNDLKAEIKGDIEKGDPTIGLFISFIDKIYKKVENLDNKEVNLSKEILKKLYELRKETGIISSNELEKDKVESNENTILEKEISTTIESNTELQGYLSNPQLKDRIISTIKGKISEDIIEEIDDLGGNELSEELREKLKQNINKIVNDNKKEFAATKKFLENPNDTESQKKYVEEIVSANPAGYMDKISSQPQEFKSKDPIINFIYNLLKLFGFNLSGMGNDFSNLESFSNIGSGLGSLSEQFESGGKGPLAINFNDNGKSSFGTYQLRSEALATFAKENGISGFQDGVLNENSEFTKNWKAKVNEIGVEKFRELEHDFIQKTHFAPQLGKIKSILPEAGKFSLSMQNVIWSVSVQHGANSNLITDVLSKGKYTPGDLQSESKFINDIYNARRTKYSNYSKRYNVEESIALSQLNAHTKSEGYIADGTKNGNWFSRPLEKNPRTGVTLCSKTAFLNLSDMGINAPRGASALESYKLSGLQQGYKDNGSSLSNLMQNSNNNVIDVYLDASSKNKEYGHRAVARREGEKWYIYDPYYSISGRDGVEASAYINHMVGKGRNFWQAKAYQGNV